jgi:TolA-binding protein
MSVLHPFLVVLSLSLAGCASLYGDGEPTIADLGRHPVQLQDTAIESNEQQAMDAYRGFLSTGDDSEARPQAMRRLADINLEAETMPRAETDNPVSLFPQQAQDSIKLYEQVLANYPERADNDSVLYQLARAYELGGSPNKSLAALQRLVQDYPEGQYRTEAEFRRGEIHFVKKAYDRASQAYQAVVDAGASSPFFEQSLYKLGWCYFKQGLYFEGLDAFTALLDIKLDSGTADPLAGLPRAERERVDDTLRVMSLSFSYEEGPRSVAGYFSQRGARHYEDIVYDRLGMLYLDKERYTDAAQTFQAFVNHNPVHTRAPAFQMRVIDAYQAGKFPTLVLQGKKDFVDRYNLQSDYWQHHERETAGEVLGFLKLTMTDLSRHYHALAQGTRKPADYVEAAHWYRSYLGSFADQPEAAGMNFLLAELLFESGHFAEATQEYVHTAYDYGEHEKAAEAGYAAVLAYEKQEATLTGKARDDWHRAGIENALRFTSSFAGHPQALAVMTKSAEQLLALDENVRAIQVAQAVIDNPAATTEQQRVSWTVQAHAWFDQQDFLHAEAAYQQVLARTPDDSKVKTELIERLAASIYKQGEAAQAAGETATAVAHLLRVRSATPGASIVATAEYDAAAGLLRLEQWDAATGTLERFRKQYPDDARQAEVTRRLATAYLNSARPLQAAQEFERIGRGAGAAGLRSDALWQSAELYAKAQVPQQSITLYAYYVQQFPSPAEAAIEARQRIAEQFRAGHDTGNYHHWLNEIIDADARAGSESSARTRYLAASARLALADAQYAQYTAVRIGQPLKKSLNTKKRLMQATLKQYEQAAGYEVAGVTTAAAFHSAQIYAHLGKALMESERPKNLDAEALEEYNILLEDQAYPFEEQAISLHETNAARVDAGLYDAWIEKSLQVLAKLVPAEYAKQEKGATHVAELR